MSGSPTLVLRNFAQVREASFELGDLTVLVGAQGTGKSLALQWLKVALDGGSIVRALREAGHVTRSPAALLDLIFGVGMGSAWTADSAVLFDGRSIRPQTIDQLGGSQDSALFIPAHRSLLVSDGWAAPFQKVTAGTPVVARIFSQQLYELFSARGEERLFPREDALSPEYREQIDQAIFHGGTVGLSEDHQHALRLELTHGAARLPFMTWTAGQREFTPLLLGLYQLFPAGNGLKRPGLDWVLIEEPELGLHPRAISVVLLLVLDLLRRGYRVVLSTHSPHLLTGVWMLQRLKEHAARWQLLCQALEVAPSPQLQRVAEHALSSSYRVHFLEFGVDGRVGARDISDLDPEAPDEGEAGWGGLTGFSSRFGDAVRAAVNESER